MRLARILFSHHSAPLAPSPMELLNFHCEKHLLDTLIMRNNGNKRINNTEESNKFDRSSQDSSLFQLQHHCGVGEIWLLYM